MLECGENHLARVSIKINGTGLFESILKLLFLYYNVKKTHFMSSQIKIRPNGMGSILVNNGNSFPYIPSG